VRELHASLLDEVAVCSLHLPCDVCRWFQLPLEFFFVCKFKCVRWAVMRMQP
jgi:hypothetical protein